jgi:hypothetical protein
MLVEMPASVSYYRTLQDVTTNITGRARELAIVFAAIMGPIVAFALIITFSILIGSAFEE